MQVRMRALVKCTSSKTVNSSVTARSTRHNLHLLNTGLFNRIPIRPAGRMCHLQADCWDRKTQWQKKDQKEEEEEQQQRHQQAEADQQTEELEVEARLERLEPGQWAQLQQQHYP